MFDRLSDNRLSKYASIELDIKRNAPFEVEEIERRVSHEFIKQNQELSDVENTIQQFCSIKDESSTDNPLLIELSERNHNRIPGSVIKGKDVFYEIKCASLNGERKEHIINTENGEVKTIKTPMDTEM